MFVHTSSFIQNVIVIVFPWWSDTCIVVWIRYLHRTLFTNFQREKTINPTRQLPLDRQQVEEFEYGTKEPNRIPLGKATLRTALEFITKHQASPKEYNAQKIALEHSLSEEKVRKLFE